MPVAHGLLALAIVAVWGTNFVVIRAGLDELPPFLFALLRFTFCAFPLVLLISRPAVPWRLMVAYGVLLGAGQFALLFWAIRADISPGLASLIVQTQVFFTVGFSVLVFREKVGLPALAGASIAAAGLAVIAWHLDATVTAKGVMLVLGAAIAWAAANTVVKKAALSSVGQFDGIAFVIWSSLFAIPPLAVLTVAFEGAGTAWAAVAGASAVAWWAVAWQVIGNTLFGYAAWNWLLTHHDASVVSPYALLIPVFGMGSSALWLGEGLPAWKLAAGALVMAGVAIAVRPRGSPERPSRSPAR